MNDEKESEVKEDLKDIDDGEFNGIKVSLYTKGLTYDTKKISLESEDTKVEVKLLDTKRPLYLTGLRMVSGLCGLSVSSLLSRKEGFV